jgi:hypothetical protein
VGGSYLDIEDSKQECIESDFGYLSCEQNNNKKSKKRVGTESDRCKVYEAAIELRRSQVVMDSPLPLVKHD